MIRTKNKFALPLICALVILSGCKKDLETIPVTKVPEKNILTIDSLRNIYQGNDLMVNISLSVYGVVTADATTGNIYKELFIQDETNAIKLSLTSSADYFVGDRIRVSLKGAIITDDGSDMITIENIDPDVAIVKQQSNVELSPQVVTIEDINIPIGETYSPLQSKLIKINNVEFDCSQVCETWADAITQSDVNRYLNDTLGNSIVVRSSGFANFAGTQLPKGQGSITAVVSQYNQYVQLTIRNPNEASLYGTRKNTCANCPIHEKNFDDNNLTSGGWSVQYPVPNNLWETDNFPGSNYYGVVDNTNNKKVGESWLISPAFNLSNTNNPAFNFKTAARSGTSSSSLKILISTDYNGTSAPSAATWTDITSNFNISTGNWSWTDSNDFDLNQHKVSGVHIAFKYTSTGATRDTWEIDTFNLLDL